MQSYDLLLLGAYDTARETLERKGKEALGPLVRHTIDEQAASRYRQIRRRLTEPGITLARREDLAYSHGRELGEDAVSTALIAPDLNPYTYRYRGCANRATWHLLVWLESDPAHRQAVLAAYRPGWTADAVRREIAPRYGGDLEGVYWSEVLAHIRECLEEAATPVVAAP